MSGFAVSPLEKKTDEGFFLKLPEMSQIKEWEVSLETTRSTTEVRDMLSEFCNMKEVGIYNRNKWGKFAGNWEEKSEAVWPNTVRMNQ